MHGAIWAIPELLASAPMPGRARLGVLMLILATLLVFAFGLLVILAVRRSLRPAGAKRAKAGQRPAAPWSEAGKRVAPIASEPESPRESGEAP